MNEQVASNKSRLLPKNILQNTQKLELFSINTRTENIYKSYQTSQAGKAWVERSGGLLKEEVECKR